MSVDDASAAPLSPADGGGPLTRSRPTAEMVALGRRLAEARLSPDGTALGWLQRGSGAAELMVTWIEAHPEADGSVVRCTDPLPVPLPVPPSTPHPSGGGAWCWVPPAPGSSALRVLVCTKEGLWLSGVGDTPARCLARASEGRSWWSPVVSPDAQWLAFVDEGTDDCCVRVADFALLLRADDLSAGESGGGESGGGESEGSLVASTGASFVLDPAWGPDGMLAWLAWDHPAMPWQSSRIEVAKVVRSDAGATTVAARGVINGTAVSQPSWCADQLCWVDDRSGWVNVSAALIQVRDGEISFVDRQAVNEPFEHGGPTWGPGQRTVAAIPPAGGSVLADSASDPARFRVAFERNEEGFGRLCVGSPRAVDDVTISATEVAVAASVELLGKGVHLSVSAARFVSGSAGDIAGGSSSVADVELVAAIRQGASTPPQVVLYARPEQALDGSDPAWQRTIAARSETLGWESIENIEPQTGSASGVPYRLYRRPDAEGPVPTIVAVHGGPTDQQRVAWNPRFAAYLAVGWQVVVPDHRGSTGWGSAYRGALDGLWGVADSDDCATVVSALIDAQLCTPNQVVVSGGSAGGFTVLRSLQRFPNLYAAGIALYPVTDLIALDETTHRFEAHYQRTLVGVRPAADDLYRQRSPMTHARDIAVPLLLFHGTEDRVVAVGQSDALVETLRQGGVPVTYRRFEGEGHGWGSPATTLAEHQAVMDFLASIQAQPKVLG